MHGNFIYEHQHRGEIGLCVLFIRLGSHAHNTRLGGIGYGINNFNNQK